jgi:hypothetical protein
MNLQPKLVWRMAPSLDKEKIVNQEFRFPAIYQFESSLIGVQNYPGAWQWNFIFAPNHTSRLRTSSMTQGFTEVYL